MIDNLRQQRSARAALTQAPVRSRVSGAGIRDSAAASSRDVIDELTFKLPMLEAEALGLRRRLAEVTADRDAMRKEIDDLRRDRDHWRKLAEQSGSKPTDTRQKTWFCGRVSAG